MIQLSSGDRAMVDTIGTSSAWFWHRLVNNVITSALRAKPYVTTAWSIIALAEVLITVSLTKRLLNTLIIYAVNRIVVIAEVILMTTAISGFIQDADNIIAWAIGMDFILSKPSLNTRQHLQSFVSGLEPDICMNTIRFTNQPTLSGDIGSSKNGVSVGMYMQKWVVGKVDSPDECRKFGHDVVISVSNGWDHFAWCSVQCTEPKIETSYQCTLDSGRLALDQLSLPPDEVSAVFWPAWLGISYTETRWWKNLQRATTSLAAYVLRCVRRARVVSIETQCLCWERVGCLPEDRIHDFFDVSQLIWIMWKAVPCRNALRKAKEGAITHLLECEGMWGYTATDFRLGRVILVEVKEETAA
ncbi:hypothetical protein EDD17DRAFT_1512461 [Pisolithus thermaeus]|nr:hypothetical protein EV401DRAFT_1894137 [Pisolithus croceorrhizus]KAI6156386.1 hypothetical protein EDD17DRAFT_1512461 [Pisolithus thermaeus]